MQEFLSGFDRAEARRLGHSFNMVELNSRSNVDWRSRRGGCAVKTRSPKPSERSDDRNRSGWLYLGPRSSKPPGPRGRVSDTRMHVNGFALYLKLANSKQPSWILLRESLHRASTALWRRHDADRMIKKGRAPIPYSPNTGTLVVKEFPVPSRPRTPLPASKIREVVDASGVWAPSSSAI
jgi:hypothetical protein